MHFFLLFPSGPTLHTLETSVLTFPYPACLQDSTGFQGYTLSRCYIWLCLGNLDKLTFFLTDTQIVLQYPNFVKSLVFIELSASPASPSCSPICRNAARSVHKSQQCTNDCVAKWLRSRVKHSSLLQTVVWSSPTWSDGQYININQSNST